ncbi:MAG: DUF1566 domain-containing protein [Kiritimatiellae bacterium]|nr:DUF1566 domain-containing protein [Kiritimatiellia bacterium]
MMTIRLTWTVAMTVMVFAFGMARAGEVRFVDNGDGTVTDSATGLMWTKNANHGRMPWKNAVDYCDKLVFAGYSDWRLPSVDQEGGSPELDTLARPRGIVGARPYAMPGAPFTDVQGGYYWSSVSDAVYSAYAWYVRMRNGGVDVDPKKYDGNVWPVRGGQGTKPVKP